MSILAFLAFIGVVGLLVLNIHLEGRIKKLEEKLGINNNDEEDKL